MLARAQEQYDKLKTKNRGRLELHHGDMRTVRLESQFKLVTCPFNAFQHMYTLDDAEQCLETVKAHLAPDGVFIMDVLTPDFEYLMRRPTKPCRG